jgi:hypothetical protein
LKNVSEYLRKLAMLKGNTMEKEMKKLHSMKVHKHLGLEKNQNTEHKNEKEKLKEEHVRRLRLILNTKLSDKVKCKQFDHWQFLY